MGITDEDCRCLKGSSSGAGEPLGVKPVEAARMLGGSRNTVYRLLKAGELRAVKNGTTTLVLVSSIHEYFENLSPATFGANRATEADVVRQPTAA